MKIAITGHTKGIGKCIKDLLEKDGHEVVGASTSTGINVMNQRASEQGTRRQILDQEVKPFSAGREICEGKKKLYEDLGT